MSESSLSLSSFSDSNLALLMRWFDMFLQQERDEMETTAEKHPERIAFVVGRIAMIRRLMSRVRNEQTRRTKEAGDG